MKTPMITAAALLLAASAFANQSTREGWSGLLRQKSLDAQGHKLNTSMTITAGIIGRKDAFSVTGYRPPQPGGPLPAQDDVYASGTVLMWWDHGNGERIGYRWSETFGGAYTREAIPAEELLMDPIGISWFSGYMETENGRARTIGGFSLEVENRGSETLTVTVTTQWTGNDVLPEHTTTHGGAIPGGSFRNIPIVPTKDEWAVASDMPSVEEK